MAINYYEKERVFKLDTPNTTYMIKLADEENFVLHMYYGKRLSDYETADLCRIEEAPFVPSRNEKDRCSFYDCAPFEYPVHGLGDFRDDAFSVRNETGHTATTLSYRSHRIYPGKPAINGLPATFGSETECTTLELICEDSYNHLEIVLVYTVFEDTDAITRSVRIVNKSEAAIFLTKAYSTCVELDAGEYDSLVLQGTWARERAIDREPLGFGRYSVGSIRGESSHQANPFMALLSRDTTEDFGEVWGFNFVYSGNFIAQAERSQFGTVRFLMGINANDFCWKLEPGAEFDTPEVVSVYSCSGIGTMTRTFHDLYRKHLIRSPYKDRKRPILINNWEATYFDFDTDKLLAIAKEAGRLGVEMLVMDDGWFGERNNDSSSLGDWFVNENKLKGGLKKLVDGVNALGLKFGIWFEPEMISPVSKLYEAHPDWAIQLPGRVAARARDQYVLDLSRPEVVEYTYNQVSTILKSANIEYVKWDMNRQLADLGSCILPADRQGELLHRYVLGVYALQERLISEFPNLLLENCSGGGGRFDPGMLYYSPQIWCSDDTDAIERLKIQQGTALVYPLSAMGAHVSDCPNHIVGRSTPFETRGYVALAGTFGYELDVTRISQADRDMIPAQVAMYHRYNDIVRNGDYFRIASFADNHEWDCWEIVTKDRSEALVTVVEAMRRPNVKSRRLKLKGLDAEKTYTVKAFDIYNPDTESDYGPVLPGSDGRRGVIRLKGDTLMYAGINVGDIYRDFGAKLLHIQQAEEV